MIDFNEHKQKKLKKEREKRASLLEELQHINTELIETKIPENTEKVSYTMTEKLKEEEIKKLKSVSSRVNAEAKNIRKKWKKEGFDPFYGMNFV